MQASAKTKAAQSPKTQVAGLLVWTANRLVRHLADAQTFIGRGLVHRRNPATVVLDRHVARAAEADEWGSGSAGSNQVVTGIVEISHQHGAVNHAVATT